MPRPTKPINSCTQKISKQEREARKEAENKIKGNVKSDRIEKVPKSLSKEGKKIYKEIINELLDSGIDLTNLDITLLEQVANSIDTMRKCQEILHQDILNKQANSVYFKAFNVFKQCASELGLSPSGRAKLSMLKKQQEDENDDLLLKILRGDDIDDDEF